MALSRMTYVVAATLLATCWMVVGIQAQGTIDPSASRVQTSIFSAFPYVNCSRTGVYRLAPVARELGSGRACFTILVDNQGCSGPCCNTDLYKIELNVSSSCLIGGVSANATINGVPVVRPSPTFDFPPLGNPGSAILRIPLPTKLDKATANGTQLCIALKTNNAGQGCTNLQQLCSAPAGACSGACSASFFDTPCDCCPVSTTTGYCPPPPPPPPPPPSPPPPTNVNNCTDSVCFDVTLSPSPSGNAVTFDAPLCSNVFNKFISLMKSNPLGNTTFFEFTTSISSDCVGKSTFRLCAVYIQEIGPKAPAGLNLSTALPQASKNITLQILDYVSSQVCPGRDKVVVTAGYSGEKCIKFQDSVSITCLQNIPPPPPFCACDTTQNVLPFYAYPFYTVQAGSLRGTTDYCFIIKTIPENQVVPSNCTGLNILSKLEFVANQAQRSLIKGFTLVPAVGASVKIAAIWGPANSNIVRATNINWGVDQANGGMVCASIANPYTLVDLCLGATCNLNLFNVNKDCCPAYTTTFPPP